MIEQIESLKASLKVQALNYCEALEQGSIDVLDSRRAKDVPRGVAVISHRRLNERRRVEPLVYALLEPSSFRVSDNIGSLPKALIDEVDIGRTYRERKAGSQTDNPVDLPAPDQSIKRP